jgi:hypothetical protein
MYIDQGSETAERKTRGHIYREPWLCLRVGFAKVRPVRPKPYPAADYDLSSWGFVDYRTEVSAGFRVRDPSCE